MNMVKGSDRSKMGTCAFCGGKRAMYTCFLMYKPDEGEFKHVNQLGEGLYINFHDKCSDLFHFNRVLELGNHMWYFRTAYDKEQYVSRIEERKVKAILTLDRAANLLIIDIAGIITYMEGVYGLSQYPGSSRIWVVGKRSRYGPRPIKATILDNYRCIIKEKW